MTDGERKRSHNKHRPRDFTTSKSALQILGKILQTENNDKWEKPKYIRTVVNQMRIRKTKYYKSQQSDKN